MQREKSVLCFLWRASFPPHFFVKKLGQKNWGRREFREGACCLLRLLQNIGRLLLRLPSPAACCHLRSPPFHPPTASFLRISSPLATYGVIKELEKLPSSTPFSKSKPKRKF